MGNTNFFPTGWIEKDNGFIGDCGSTGISLIDQTVLAKDTPLGIDVEDLN